MHKRRVILLVVIATICFAIYAYSRLVPAPQVELTFIHYSYSPTNDTHWAEFELKNKGDKPIWLLVSGRDLPWLPTVMNRPVNPSPPETNFAGSNLFAVTVGSYFMGSEQIAPHENYVLSNWLEPLTPPERIGLNYFTPGLNGSNDILHVGDFCLSKNSSLSERLALEWQKWRGKLLNPHSHEIWCDRVISYQDAVAATFPNRASNSITKQPAPSLH